MMNIRYNYDKKAEIDEKAGNNLGNAGSADSEARRPPSLDDEGITGGQVHRVWTL